MATLTSPTLQQLLTSTRTMLNQPKEANSFWKDVELTEYLNEAVRVYFTECVMADEGYFTTQSDLNIAADTETVALPSDCFQVKNLYKAVSGGYVLLNYNNSLTESYTSTGNTVGDSYIPTYHFRGNSLVLRPTPNGAQTSGLRLTYLQFPDQMVWGGDSLTAQVSPIFKQLIIMYAVYKAKLRESLVNGIDTYGVAQQHVAELYKLFKDALARRSKNPTFTLPFNPESE